MLPLQIQAAFDSYFSYLVKNKIDWLPIDVPKEMTIGGPDEEDFIQWRPVMSRVTPADLTEFGRSLGVRFGPQYSAVLQYKHFMQLEIYDLGFFPHPSEGWMDSLSTHVLQGHPRELLLDKGMLPFANCSDWGLYCFRLAEQCPSGEYAVYRWDHDDPQNFEPLGQDLYGTLLAFAAMSEA